MHRIFLACKESLVSFIFLIPIFAICNRFVFHRLRHTLLYLLFSFYLTAVMSLVGLPNVTNFEFDPGVHLIPFDGMIADMENSLLNILLFVPMGFLLPVLWQAYRRRWRTAAVCLCVSCSIEILQLFAFRLTDLNDVITNLLGGIIGYFAAKVLTRGFSKAVCVGTKTHEMLLVFALSFAVMFFATPFIPL